ncbi:hypothetical protein [Evansella clarkii]|uniref:hypothetical protein n=1 Tax=Evansella clarkii TaxID=79879 RepID=UPI002F2637AD
MIYFEDTDSLSVYTVAHYDCFVKVDVFYYTPDKIQPTVWLQNIKIIKDTNGMMASILEKSMKYTYQPSPEEIEVWRTKFFAHLHEAYRRAMRKEYYYALQSVDNLRLAISAAWYMEKGVQTNAFGDWAKYEGGRSKLDPWQKSLLESWECGRSTMEIMTVMKSIVHEFKTVHSSLCTKLGIEEDSALIDKIVNTVI